MARDDASLLVIFRGISGQLKHLSGQVLKNRSGINHRSGADTRRNLGSAQVSADTSHWKLQSCSLALTDGFTTAFASAAFAADSADTCQSKI